LLKTLLMWSSFLFFFFSSRRRHTILQGDWSSDVCSSDLTRTMRIDYVFHFLRMVLVRHQHSVGCLDNDEIFHADGRNEPVLRSRSEERRVGKESKVRSEA